jgi:hypothetical protein
MDLGTPQDWAQGAGAFKSAVDAIGSVIRIMKDLRGRKASPEEQAMLDKAIGEAEKAAKIADAQTAKALGYTLCHCAFPPVAMLTVGWMYERGQRIAHAIPVYQCPSCGFNTAGLNDYQPLMKRSVP